MFGYVRADVKELRVKEHEYYKATYCGLCHAMGSCTGQCSRMSLSYDFTLFVLLRAALVGESISFMQKRCIAHPIKKRNVMKRNGVLDFSAYASALLTYHKVRDDIADSKFLRSLFVRIFILPSAKTMRRRALRACHELAELDKICAECLMKISRLEEERCASADMPAALFGEILAEFLSFGLDGADRRIARSIGMSIGRWIYIADALDDMEDDLKRSNYNPFLEMYGGALPSGEQVGDIVLAIKNGLYEAEAAIDLIDFSQNETMKNIILNILYMGMPERVQKIADGYSNESRKENENERPL